MFFEELWTLYSTPGITKGYSGFVFETQALPYISLQNTSHTVIAKLSTLQQEERLTYSFIAYGRTHKELRDIFKTLQSDYSAGLFTPADSNITLLDLEWQTLSIGEIKPQLFGGVMSVSLVVSRLPDTTKISSQNVSSYDNIFEPLRLRWNTYRGSYPDILLGNYLPEKTALPYFSFVDESQKITGHNTVSRLEEKELNLDLYTRNLASAEAIIDLAINVFNHSSYFVDPLPGNPIQTRATDWVIDRLYNNITERDLTVDTENNLVMNFSQCKFEESRPNIWKSNIRYDLTFSRLRKNYV